MTARNASYVLMLIAGMGILAYAMLRAANASFTHDESLTYLLYPHQSLGDILAHKEAYTNNHLLNTLGMKISERLFGTSEFVLRLPNLLALLIYMVYAALLVRPLPAWAGFALFVILITNADIVELFTLARGYGLSFGFMLMALFHLVAYVRTTKLWHAVLFHAACMLAVLSNFTLLDLYAAAMGLLVMAALLVWWLMPERRSVMWRSVAVHGVLLFLAVLGIWEPVRQVVTQNHFDFGGQQGFYRDTVRSVVFASFPGLFVDEGLLLLFQVMFTAFMVTGLVLIGLRVARKDRAFFGERTTFVVITGVLFLTCVVSTLQHVILGTDHLTARFAKFLLPLLALHIGLLAVAITAHRGRMVTMIVLLVLAGISMRSFIHNSSFHRSNEWQYDVETKDMMKELVADHARAPDRSASIRIGNTWLFEPTINFYRVIWHVDELLPAHRNGPEGNEDYLYVDSQFAEVDTARYVLVKAYDKAGARLYAHRARGDAKRPEPGVLP